MENDVKMDIYEVGYLLVPSIADENVGGEVTRLKDSLSLHGAVFISDEYPKLIDLAYQMARTVLNKKQKFDKGYFGWVKFEMPKDEALKAKEMLNMDESLIRFIFIKTVRESTLSPKRSYTNTDGRKKTFLAPKVKVEEGPKEEINEETIDKDIDALVVE